MAAFETIKAKLAALLTGANQTTGGADTNLTDAMTRLREGYGKAVTQPLTVVENGSYAPPEGVDGFNLVDVNVSADVPDTPAINTGPLEVSENGHYNPGTNGFDYFESVVVDVHATLQTKTVTENGTVTPDAGFDGLSSVIVDVPAPAGGGDAHMVLQDANLTVGSYIFQDFDTGLFSNLPQNLALCVVVWGQLFIGVLGSEMNYMPSTVLLFLDDLVILNGAFYADSIDLSGENQIAYSGSDVTGAYRLDMVLESSADGDKLLSITLTNNGDAVDTSGGLSAYIYFTMPVND